MLNSAAVSTAKIATKSPCPAPISVVRKITENFGFIRTAVRGSRRRSPRHQVVERRIGGWRLRQQSVDLERVVFARQLVGVDPALGLAARQVVVGGMRP